MEEQQQQQQPAVYVDDQPDQEQREPAVALKKRRERKQAKREGFAMDYCSQLVRAKKYCILVVLVALVLLANVINMSLQGYSGRSDAEEADADHDNVTTPEELAAYRGKLAFRKAASKFFSNVARRIAEQSSVAGMLSEADHAGLLNISALLPN